MPTRDEMTIDERRKYVKLMSEQQAASQAFDPAAQRGELGTQDPQHPPEPQLWAGSRAGGAAGVGEPGLHLC